MFEKIKEYVKIPQYGTLQENIKVPEYGRLKEYLASLPEYTKTLNKMITLERCEITNKPEVCDANLWKIRSWCFAATLGSGYLGAKAIPLMGFDATGVIPNSTAAAWQSSIGSVAAGSLFSILQSLGATGTGVLLTGSVSAGLPLLVGLVAEKKLDWCTCQYDKGMLKSKI